MADVECRVFPRVMIAAPGSGQGKTMITCGILSLLQGEDFDVRAFKCGPDYIDPMFHRQVLGVPSYNLDSFFSDRNTLSYLLGRHGNQTDGTKTDDVKRIGILEGVMGYYDGLGGVTDRASSHEVAVITKTPVILVADASGSSLSVLATLKGFLKFRRNSRICGVIFNRLAPGLYPRLKELAEQELGVSVIGYVPKLKNISWENRHLGLIRPEEIDGFGQQVRELSEAIRPTIDLEALIRLAEKAEPLRWRPFATPIVWKKDRSAPVIAVAMDEAFCFYYQDNLELLTAMGAKLCYFSPIRDRELPKDACGLYLGGGYPELFCKELSGNRTMRESILHSLRAGLPCIAECGGYLYLKEWMEDKEGVSWEMAGFLKGKSANAGQLRRFGYVTLEAERDSFLGGPGSRIPAHEFHYWDCEDNGDCFHAVKPVTGRSWDCGYADERFYAGFPHLYFYSSFPYGFMRRAAEWSGAYE